MRVVAEIPHPLCKISIFQWNNRYLIKIESDMLEQTYKIDQMDISSEAELLRIIDEHFIHSCMKQFTEMARNLHTAMDKI